MSDQENPVNDFLNETHYWEDESWCAHRFYRLFLGIGMDLNENGTIGFRRFAENVFVLPHNLSDI
ncbi:hypothetical protein IOC57_11035 [Bacillus sp. SD075]|uniref:hypothetical protein n=1 Tax=Bacillus sp. SD075 TaxID=2781732 RepID=UPI001A95B984|nr:hypothetical protein [Bacillus sp. SD075]MBO0998276.1 hypothetical protein [Bacillus sp. SD075]